LSETKLYLVSNGFKVWYGAQPRALRALLTINVVAWLLWFLPLSRIPVVHAFVWEYLALEPELPGLLLEPWQLVTYNFLHLGSPGGAPGFGSLLHVGFNMLWLYWIGKEYEEMHGAQRLLAVYLLAGLGGGLLSVLAYTFVPATAVVHGASASVLGVITVVAVRYPYKKIRLFLLGTWRLVHLVVGFLVLDVLMMLLATTNTAVAAHLGGALVGFLFVRGEERGRDLSSWTRVFFGTGGRSRGGRSTRRSRSSRSRKGWLDRMEAWLADRMPGQSGSGGGQQEEPSARRPSRRQRTASPGGTSTDSDTEVDRILDKISERGFDALTDEEKRVLHEASQE
jgi:membrane associated rhomboid family serine protease